MATTMTRKRIKPATPFSSMSTARRRIAIAKDVIAALKARRYKALSGTYVESTSATAKGLLPENVRAFDAVEVDAREALLRNMKSCAVCAKGAMFVAAVERFDRLKVNVYDEEDSVLEDFAYDAAICDQLSAYFPQRQLDLIEAAFEGRSIIEERVSFNWGWMEGAIAIAAAKFRAIYRSPTARMIAIMRNIIRNKGTFVCTEAELNRR